MGTVVDGDGDGDEQPGGYWLAREARRGIAIVIVTVMEEWPKGCGIEMTGRTHRTRRADSCALPRAGLDK